MLRCCLVGCLVVGFVVVIWVDVFVFGSVCLVSCVFVGCDVC